MKATIDIPDELYRRVKAKSALQGRHVREVTIELYQRWLSSREGPSQPAVQSDWLAAWLKHSIPKRQSGPTAREILAEGRGRLDAKNHADR